MAKKKFPAPVRPFILARYFGGAQVPKAIVIHGTVSSDNAGTARNIANWWAGPTSPKTSAHYVTDPNEDIQCVGDHSVAYHCGFNSDTIGHELCDEQTGPASRWTDPDSEAIIERAALLDAELCLAYGIKPIRPTVAALKRKGPHGIYGHNDSRLAFGHTTHTDPRDFPWAHYINRVQWHVRNLRGEIKRDGVRVNLITFNVGSAPYADIVEVISNGDVAALQECSDRDDVMNRLLAAGYGVIRPELLGAPATPLVYDKTKLLFRREIVFRLLKSQDNGPGTGPDRNKPKYFVGGLFEVLGTGRYIIAGSAHNITSQKRSNLRARVALAFTSALNRGLRVRRVALVAAGADWNAEQDDPSLAPFRRKPWQMSTPFATHGRRAIDFWVYKVREESGQPVATSIYSVKILGRRSDHDASLLGVLILSKAILKRRR